MTVTQLHREAQRLTAGLLGDDHHDNDEPPGTHTPNDNDPTPPALAFRTIAEVAESVRNAPLPTWLIRSIFPSDAHGVFAAEDKAGKSWAMYDLAVTVAAGRTWLNHWQIDNPGPVLVFVGEGSERKSMRRLYAVGAHHGLAPDDVDALPIMLCHRVPLLSNAEHVGLVMTHLAAHPPHLVILDPFYLAAAGAEASQLMKMAVPLGVIQHATQSVGAALIVVHHWNQTGDGTSRKRFSGAGTAEWGRVLASMSVLRKRTEDPEGQARTVVDLKLEIIGDEIPDTETTFRRTVWADDPADLASPLHYEIERTELDPTRRSETDDTEWSGPTECMAALRHFFTDHPTESISKSATASRLRALGLSYRNNTIGDALERLAVEGFLGVANGARNARNFTLNTNAEALNL